MRGKRKEKALQKSIPEAICVYIGALIVLFGITARYCASWQEAFFLMALGFLIAWFAERIAGLYNIRFFVVMLRARRRKKFRRKTKKSAEKSADQS